MRRTRQRHLRSLPMKLSLTHLMAESASELRDLPQSMDRMAYLQKAQAGGWPDCWDRLRNRRSRSAQTRHRPWTA